MTPRRPGVAKIENFLRGSADMPTLVRPVELAGVSHGHSSMSGDLFVKRGTATTRRVASGTATLNQSREDEVLVRAIRRVLEEDTDPYARLATDLTIFTGSALLTSEVAHMAGQHGPGWGMFGGVIVYAYFARKRAVATRS